MSTLASGQKCYYRKCENTRRTIKGLRLFRFPNDPDIREIWIRNSGNPDLAFMSAKVLRNRHLCQCHFDPKDIKSTGYMIKGSVPFKYKPKPNVSNNTIKVADTSAKISSAEDFDETVLSEFLNFESATEDPIECTDDACERKITKLKEQVRKQSKVIKNKSSLISRLRARVRELKSLQDMNKSFGIVSPKARRIAQIKGHERKLVGQKKKTS